MVTLSSSAAITVVFNTGLAVKMLGEKATKYDAFSITVICLGATVCLMAASY